MFACIYVWLYVCTSIHTFLSIVFWGSKQTLFAIWTPAQKNGNKMQVYILIPLTIIKTWSVSWRSSKTITLLLFTCHSITSVSSVRSSNSENLDDASFTGMSPYFWQINSLVNFCCSQQNDTNETLKFNVAASKLLACLGLPEPHVHFC